MSCRRCREADDRLDSIAKRELEKQKAREALPGVFVGVVLKADTPTINGNIYPSAVLYKSIKEYLERGHTFGVSVGSGYGGGKINLKDVSHKVREIDMVEGDVVAEVELLPTPPGDMVRQLAAAGVDLGLFMRGEGGVVQDEDGNHIVQDDFKIISIDIGEESRRHKQLVTLEEGYVHAPYVPKMKCGACAEEENTGTTLSEHT